MPKIPGRNKGGKGKEPICKACLDTGKDSHGGPCIPCIMAGRIKRKWKSVDIRDNEITFKMKYS